LPKLAKAHFTSITEFSSILMDLRVLYGFRLSFAVKKVFSLIEGDYSVFEKMSDAGLLPN